MTSKGDRMACESDVQIGLPISEISRLAIVRIFRYFDAMEQGRCQDAKTAVDNIVCLSD